MTPVSNLAGGHTNKSPPDESGGDCLFLLRYPTPRLVSD